MSNMIELEFSLVSSAKLRANMKTKELHYEKACGVCCDNLTNVCTKMNMTQYIMESIEQLSETMLKDKLCKV